MAEAAIRQRVEDGVKALRAKDIDAVMSLYASNIVSLISVRRCDTPELIRSVEPGKKSPVHRWSHRLRSTRA